MKKRKKIPYSWILEEFAFGAVNLRDKIRRHREVDEEP